MPSTRPVALRRVPELTVATPRLHVRPLTGEDAEHVAEIFGDRVTRRWLPVQEEHERRDSYAVVRREDGRVIGCVWTKRTDWAAQSTEIAFAVAADARGFGVAAEAVDALTVALILEHGFQRVELRIAPGNVACRRVAEKAGFTYEGVLRNAGHVHSGRVDLQVWSLVAADLR
jgi:[ribosomal protein S5]-alanine N-acetyltransferase